MVRGREWRWNQNQPRIFTGVYAIWTRWQIFRCRNRGLNWNLRGSFCSWVLHLKRKYWICLVATRKQEKQRKKKKLHEKALIPYWEKYEHFLINKWIQISLYMLHKLNPSSITNSSYARTREKGREKQKMNWMAKNLQKNPNCHQLFVNSAKCVWIIIKVSGLYG